MADATGVCGGGRMGAGGSQAAQSMTYVLRAVDADKRAWRHRAGCAGEQVVCRVLSTMALSGVHHLDDRRCAADTQNRANLDHIVVGSTGVFVVDAKLWGGRIEVRDNTIVQDGVPRAERVISIPWMRNRIEEVMATTSAAALRPVPVVCFAKPVSSLPPALGDVLLADITTLPDVISRRPVLLSPDQVSELVDVLSYAFPPYHVDPQEVAEAHGLLFPDLVARHAGLREALAAPVEEWMAWLHPEQASTVRRSFTGPARIRGAAGTGKTCVGLHRVAWLASTRPGRFLVTSFVRTLPQVLEQSYVRLSPRTADRVDFTHVHGVAVDLLAERGIKPVIKFRSGAFAAAWRREGAELETTGLSRKYLDEEVQHVIKGRDLRTLDEYLALDRVGRRTPLRADAREKVWRLAVAYEDELRRRGEHDYTDVLRMARDSVRAKALRRWTAVMVDEAQDIPLVGLQLLHELAGLDRPDGLLLIGDGQQAIYPGGYRLSEAGISVAGRATVLRTNYRNTVEVLATAKAIVQADQYDDLDTVGESGDRDVEVVRHGEIPTNVVYADRDEHDAALLWDLQALSDRLGSWTGIALLAPTNYVVAEYDELLRSKGIPTVLLKDKALKPGLDAVVLGTWFRSKGMEYPHVFLPEVNRWPIDSVDPEERAEKEELYRRTLYVAMTRARDTLWVGRVPSIRVRAS